MSLFPTDYEFTTGAVLERAGSIGQDIQIIIGQHGLKTNAGDANAKQLYEKGAFCQTHASLTISTPVDQIIPKGTPVSGTNRDGSKVQGTIYEEIPANATSYKIQYLIVPQPDEKESSAITKVCSVGGNPSPKKSTCLKESGQLTIEAIPGTVQYSSYDPEQNTSNGLFLKRLSRSIPANPGNDIPTVQSFVDYFGAPDYADLWIQAAFERKSETGLKNGGQADFTYFQQRGTHEIINTSMTSMSLWMQVVRNIEEAASRCSTNKNRALELWDDAVSFYYGVGGAKNAPLYNLANENCILFGTCVRTDSNGVQIAKVNSKLESLFKEGKADLMDSNCNAINIVASKIIPQMTIPLLQAFLYTSYVVDEYQQQREIYQGPVVGFGTAILPLVHKCNPGRASGIAATMKVGSTTSLTFTAVKKNLQAVYDCLDITCEDVGGIVNPAKKNQWLKKAHPCGVTTDEPVPSPTTAPRPTNGIPTEEFDATLANRESDDGLVMGMAIGLPILFVILVVLYCRYVCGRGAPSGKEMEKTGSMDVESDFEMTSKDETAASKGEMA